MSILPCSECVIIVSNDAGSDLMSLVQTAVLFLTLMVSVAIALFTFLRDRGEKRLDRRTHLYESYVREGASLLDAKHFLATGSTSVSFAKFDLVCNLLETEMLRRPKPATELDKRMKGINKTIKFGRPAPTPEKFLSDSEILLPWVRTGKDIG